MLIYGGVTFFKISHITYSNFAFLWSDEKWAKIPNENPCPLGNQGLTFQQPCASRVQGNQTNVIIVTFPNSNHPCTSMLNMNTFEWSLVPNTGLTIPMGGHLITSLDHSKVFYLGGIYNGHQTSQSLDVYELGSNGWQLTGIKLPFGIVSNETKSYPSLHNVTLDK